MREPMILLLISAAVIYFFLGELRDSLVLMGSIFFVVGIDLYQQRKTEHALEALRDLSSPRAMVIRDGQQRRIAGREVARGDIVIVSEGDRIRYATLARLRVPRRSMLRRTAPRFGSRRASTLLT
jgi:Ca2+-transporting ATPase